MRVCLIMLYIHFLICALLLDYFLDLVGYLVVLFASMFALIFCFVVYG